MIYLKSLLALVFVLGLIVLLYAALQRLGGGMGGRRNRRIQVLESVSLGDRRQLFLVQVHRQNFLLAAAGRQLSLLSTVDPETTHITEEASDKTLPRRALTVLQANEGV